MAALAPPVEHQYRHVVVQETGCATPTHLSAQGWTGDPARRVTGLPFQLEPNVSVEGWHINSNDNGQIDFGEFVVPTGAVDVGGAGPTFPDWMTHCTPCIFHNVTILETSVQREYFSPSGVVHFWTDTWEFEIAGKRAILRFPTVGTSPVFASGGAYGSAGECADWFVVAIRPTRSNTLHQPGPPINLPGVPELEARGAWVAHVEDQRGQHPLVETAQNCIFLAGSAHLILGIEKVVLFGGSFGTAAGLAIAQLFPSLFQGFMGSGGYLSLPEFEEWNWMARLLEECQGRNSILFSTDGTNRNGIGTLMGWRGLSRWHFDLTRPEVLQQIKIPTLMAQAGCDGHWVPNGSVQDVNALLQTTQVGGVDMTDYVRILENREAGHSHQWPAGCFSEAYQFTDTDIQFFIDAVNRSIPVGGSAPIGGPANPTFTPPDMVTTPLGYQASGKYDSFLSASKAVGINEDPLQSPLPEAPFVLHDRIGRETGVGRWPGSACLVGDVLYHGDRAGFVYRRTWNASTQEFDVDWKCFAGPGVMSVAVGVLGGGAGTIVAVGSPRGIVILDDAGQEIANDLTFHDVRSITIADADPTNDGNELIYQSVWSKLCVSTVSGSQVVPLHHQDIGNVGRIVVADVGGTPSIFAAMTHGHVARLELQKNNNQYAFVCSAVSEYLEGSPCDMAFVPGAGQNADRLVTATLVPGDDPGTSAVVDDFYPIWAFDLDLTTIAGPVSVPKAQVVRPGGAGVLVGHVEDVREYDLNLSLQNTFTGVGASGIFAENQGAASTIAFVGFGLDGAICTFDSAWNPVGMPPVGRKSTSAAAHVYSTADFEWQVSLLVPGSAAQPGELGPPLVESKGRTWRVDTYGVRLNGARWELQPVGGTPPEFRCHHYHYETPPGQSDPVLIPSAATNNYPAHRHLPTVLHRLASSAGVAGNLLTSDHFTTFRHAGGVERLSEGSSDAVWFSSDAGRLSYYAPTDLGPSLGVIEPEMVFQLWAKDNEYGLTSPFPPGTYCDIRFGKGVRSSSGDVRTEADVLAEFAPSGFPFLSASESDGAVNFWAADGYSSAIDYVGVAAARMRWNAGEDPFWGRSGVFSGWAIGGFRSSSNDPTGNRCGDSGGRNPTDRLRSRVWDDGLGAR